MNITTGNSNWFTFFIIDKWKTTGRMMLINCCNINHWNTILSHQQLICIKFQPVQYLLRRFVFYDVTHIFFATFERLLCNTFYAIMWIVLYMLSGKFIYIIKGNSLSNIFDPIYVVERIISIWQYNLCHACTKHNNR